MRTPRSFFAPLALGAPEPLREIPVKPSRMIHFLDFSNEKMVAKVPDIAPTVDILLGNLEDAVPVDRKLAARDGLIRVGRETYVVPMSAMCWPAQQKGGPRAPIQASAWLPGRVTTATPAWR